MPSIDHALVLLEGTIVTCPIFFLSLRDRIQQTEQHIPFFITATTATENRLLFQIQRESFDILSQITLLPDRKEYVMEIYFSAIIVHRGDEEIFDEFRSIRHRFVESSRNLFFFVSQCYCPLKFYFFRCSIFFHLIRNLFEVFFHVWCIKHFHLNFSISTQSQLSLDIVEVRSSKFLS